jgi:hypothetical protein
MTVRENICICTCLCIYIHTYMHSPIHIYAYRHPYTHTRTYTHMCTHTHTHMEYMGKNPLIWSVEDIWMCVWVAGRKITYINSMCIQCGRTMVILCIRDRFAFWRSAYWNKVQYYTRWLLNRKLCMPKRIDHQWILNKMCTEYEYYIEGSLDTK